MGLTKSAIKILLDERNRRPFSGSILLLGKQDIYIDHSTLISLAREWKVPLVLLPNVETSEKNNLKFKGYISEKHLFKSLGFSEVQSLDASNYENAEIVFDLNSNETPDSLKGKFDLILDGGTLEHVFHFPNALKNVFNMLKINGRIIHFSPSSNYMDHGFYMFSPTVFWDFYKTNRFEINQMQVFRHTPFAPIDKWEISNYASGCLNPINFGGLDSAMYGIIGIVTKQIDSTGDRVPQQGTFEKLWQGVPASSFSRIFKFDALVNSIMHSVNPALHFIRKCQPLRRYGWYILKMIKKLRKKGLKLKILSRY